VAALVPHIRGDYYASFSYKVKEAGQSSGQVVAFDLGIKTLATGTNEQGRFYHIGGFKGSQWYNRQLDKIRSKRDTCKKKSRRYIHLSNVYKRVAQKKRNKQRDSLHKASHLIAHKLVERTVVIGDLSQRQMVMREHQERKKALNRAVFNDWGLYIFIQMLTYKCQLYGKELVLENERNTSKTCSECGNLQAMPLWKRTYCCMNCGLVMDRDDNSAVNILTRFLARRGPHTSSGMCGVL
jgi:putative transposase